MNKGTLVRGQQTRDERVYGERHRCHGCHKVIAPNQVRRVSVTITGSDVYWHDECGK